MLEGRFARESIQRLHDQLGAPLDTPGLKIFQKVTKRTSFAMVTVESRESPVKNLLILQYISFTVGTGVIDLPALAMAESLTG